MTAPIEPGHVFKAKSERFYRHVMKTILLDTIAGLPDLEITRHELAQVGLPAIADAETAELAGRAFHDLSLILAHLAEDLVAYEAAKVAQTAKAHLGHMPEVGFGVERLRQAINELFPADRPQRAADAAW